MALEAAACCLQVLASPGLPQQLYREELVTGLVTLAKYHLQYNLLVMYDGKYRRIYRPSSMAPDASVEVGAPSGPEAVPGGPSGPCLQHAAPCAPACRAVRCQACAKLLLVDRLTCPRQADAKGKGKKKPKLERQGSSLKCAGQAPRRLRWCAEQDPATRGLACM